MALFTLVRLFRQLTQLHIYLCLPCSSPLSPFNFAEMWPVLLIQWRHAGSWKLLNLSNRALLNCLNMHAASFRRKWYFFFLPSLFHSQEAFIACTNYIVTSLKRQALQHTNTLYLAKTFGKIKQFFYIIFFLFKFYQITKTAVAPS